MDKTIHTFDVRVGTQLNYNTGESIEVTTLDWQDIKWIEEDMEGFNRDHSPIVLTEDLMRKIRCQYRDDSDRIEFSCTPPGERQIENNWWSREVNDFSRLHLTPSYPSSLKEGQRVKANVPEFWYCWICAHGTGSDWFLSLAGIRGKSQLRYFHQLQNLYLALTGFRLFIPLS